MRSVRFALTGCCAALAITSGCALLYDFGDGTGGANGTTTPDASATGADRGPSATTIDASAQSASSDGGASTGLPPPVEEKAAVFGSGARDEGIALAVTPTGSVVIGLRLGDDAMIGTMPIAFENNAAIVTASLDQGFDVTWAKLEVEVHDFEAAEARPVRILALANGRILAYGAMNGTFYEAQGGARTLAPGVWAMRRAADGDAERSFHADGGSDLSVGGAVEMDGGAVLLGINAATAIYPGNGAMIPVNFPSGSVLLSLDPDLVPGAFVPADVAGGDTMIDLARASDGVTASMINLEASGTPKVVYVPPEGEHPSTSVEGRVALVRGEGVAQRYCETMPQDPSAPPNAIRVGELTVGATVSTSPWLAIPGTARLVAAAALDSDIVVAGTYVGPSFAGLPAADASDGFVMRVSPAGNVMWALRVGGVGDQLIQGLVVTDAAIYVVGTTSDDLDFAGQSHPVLGGGDAFVAHWTMSP